MKLKQDCIRDLMLYLEENLSYDNYVNVFALKLKGHSTEDLVYTADKLYEAGYIEAGRQELSGSAPLIRVFSITYEGHQFLENIRDSKVWAEVKNKTSKMASVSLPVLQQVALSLIKSKLGLG